LALTRVLSSNLWAGVAIGATAFLVAALAREAGIFERADLALHDRLVRASYPAVEDDRFVVVLESEEDLRRWKFPLSDDVFAQLITRIMAGEPAAIAIDKYRDVPVEPGSQRLAELLRTSDRVFWVKKLGSRPADDVPAPAALDSRFVGCGDIVDDRDGMVRRALLYLNEEQRDCFALGFQVARHLAAARKLSFASAKGDADRYDLGASHVRALEACSGPYANVDAGGFQSAWPSAGAPRFRTVGMTDVLEGRVPPETFRGKAVLFGSRAESLRDFFNMPSAAGEGLAKVSGVEIHTAIASHLLGVAEGRVLPMQLLPRGFALALAGLFALAAGVVACARRSLPVTLGGFFALALLLALIVALMSQRGIFTGVTTAAAAMSLAFVAGVVRSGWVERRERAQLMSLFGRHVAPEVADDLWRRRDEFFANGAVQPREIVATIFFLDIRGFTTVSEKLDAARVVPWLNRGLTVMIDEIMRHEGVVTRFAGDAVMAIFGSPVPRHTEEARAKDAVNAIDAALAIGPALDRLNAQYVEEGLPKIRVRIGINTGQVTQCSVGASNRTEFTVLGDPTNTASRLESYAMEDAGETVRILIGDETFRCVGERYDVRLVGSIALKGKELPVTVRQVLSRR
jgi:adenylate cyclase